MKRSRGYTLIELVVSIGLFGLILATSFLPFKIMRDSCSSGGAREDLDANVRITVQRMIRRLHCATNVSFSPDFPTASIYRQCSFQLADDSSGTTYSYYWEAVPGTTNEYRLMEDHQIGGASLAGYPKILISNGVTAFYFAPTRCTSGGSYEYAYALLFMCVYPSDAQRPLPDKAKTPVTIATGIAFRNGASQLHPALLNPNLYP
jgi:prepilin-type N-terminal cleavage/methylation domain-containing protein